MKSVDKFNGSNKFYFDKSQPYYKLLGRKGILLRRALRQKNVVVDIFPERGRKKVRWVARGADKVIVFRNTMTTSTFEWRGVTNDKFQTKKILNEYGVKVPSGVTLEPNNIQDALCWFDSLSNKKVVVKPVLGSGGRGVTSSITSREKFEEAYNSVATSKVVLEEHIEGDDHRILVLDGKVIAAMRRWPAHVIGDGNKSIANLVKDKNLIRKENPYDHKYLLKIDAIALEVLKSQGYSANTVLELGQIAYLRKVANIGAGGDGEDVTNKIHQDFIDVAVKSSKAFQGIECLGVDLIAEDITQPASVQNYAVIELNANCDIPIHHWPAKGDALDVASAIADHYFPNDKKDLSYAVKVEITGRVRNVGYQKWLCKQALIYGVNGYCKSSEGGAVEALFEGSKNSVDSLVSLCADGPEKSLVKNVVFEKVPASSYQSFSML